MPIPPYKRNYQYSNRNIRQLADALCPYLKLIGCSEGGGGALVIEVTYSAIRSLISTSGLTPGTTYKITGFNKDMPNGGPDNPYSLLPETLYNDGTNSGITIYMQAISESEMATSGYGEFYNPKYYNSNYYHNTDGTGLYGIWDGDNPNSGAVPAYIFGQVVFWGGYAWQNLTGNVGYAVDILTLNSDDWVKIQYSNPDVYNQVIDEISVDWNNGILVKRINRENEISIEFNGSQYKFYLELYDGIQANPISFMGWGIYPTVLQGAGPYMYGMSNVLGVNSLVETVNYKGVWFTNNRFSDSFYYGNYQGIDSVFASITISDRSKYTGNVSIGASIYFNEIIIYSKMSDNTFYYSDIFENTVSTESEFQYNSVNYCQYFNNNHLLNGSWLNANTITYGGFASNILNNGSKIYANTVDQSLLSGNTCFSGEIHGNTITQSSQIIGNTLTNSVIASGTYFNAGRLLNNVLYNSSLAFNLQNSVYFKRNHFNDVNITIPTLKTNPLGFIEMEGVVFNGPFTTSVNFNSATVIFSPGSSKQVFKCADGTIGLLYYANFTTPTMVTINA